MTRSISNMIILVLFAIMLFTVNLTMATTFQPCQPTIHSSANPPPQAFKTDLVLQKKIENLISNFRGDIGVYVRSIRGTDAGVNHLTTFPTASIVKIPILIGMHAKLFNTEMTLDDPYIYRESQAYPGSGLMQHFKDNTPVDIKTLVFMMIAFSDNVASLANQHLAGGGAEINTILNQYGFNQTFVNSGTPGREEDWKRWGWGQTTPFEMVNIITAIRNKVFFSSEMSESMYRFLGNHFYDERSLSQIGVFTKTASKSGSLDASRSEVVYVNNYNDNGEYTFSIFTNNNRDQSWGPDNEAEELSRQLSKMLWEYYGSGQ